MWIRSQDKTNLRNYNGIFINYTNKKNICGDALFNEEGESWYTIGSYKTEERAMEVLNEIQNWIETMEYIKIRPVEWQGDLLVYKMPAE